MPIYLDHAATTPLDNEILQKMLPYMTGGYGNADSLHALGRQAMNAVDTARDTIAELLGVKANEIYFTSGGTESDNWAVRGAAYAQKEQGKDQIILSAIEHHAVLSTVEKLKNEGFEIVYLPTNVGGRVELNALKAVLSSRTALVCLMAVNNETGVAQPITEAAELAKEYGALFFSDCVQAAPYFPLRPRESGIDIMSFSSHKLYGPKGCGVLYIRSGVKIKGLIVGGEQERGLRGGTTNVPAVVGCGFAYQKAVQTMQENNAKIADLRALFLQEIAEVEGVKINGEGVPALLNLQIDGVNNHELLYKMDLQGVCIAAGSACASASLKPSHVLLAMGLTEDQAKKSVRISFGKDNTQEEIVQAAQIFKQSVAILRQK